MGRYRKLPVVVDAILWTGSNYGEVYGWRDKLEGQGAVWRGCMGTLLIPTLEGEMEASPGDWIIRGVNGEFYPCKPDIFSKTYEVAE